jgi:hypothetical protein
MLTLVRQAFEGRYEVEREIGKGGNARIFLAREPGGRPVALKILHPELLVSVAADRFLREIKLASQLNHPHIAHLLDSGERDWLVYFVMTYHEGATLREFLAQRGRLSIADTLRVADNLLDALEHAHGRHHPPRREAGKRRGFAAGLASRLRHRARGLGSGSDRLTRSGIAVGTSTCWVRADHRAPGDRARATSTRSHASVRVPGRAAAVRAQERSRGAADASHQPRPTSDDRPGSRPSWPRESAGRWPNAGRAVADGGGDAGRAGCGDGRVARVGESSAARRRSHAPGMAPFGSSLNFRNATASSSSVNDPLDRLRSALGIGTTWSVGR